MVRAGADCDEAGRHHDLYVARGRPPGNGDLDRRVLAHRDPRRHRYPAALADGDAHSLGDAHAITDRHPVAHAEPYSDPNSYPDALAHGHALADFHCHLDSCAATYPHLDAKAHGYSRDAAYDCANSYSDEAPAQAVASRARVVCEFTCDSRQSGAALTCF